MSKNSKTKSKTNKSGKTKGKSASNKGGSKGSVAKTINASKKSGSKKSGSKAKSSQPKHHHHHHHHHHKRHGPSITSKSRANQRGSRGSTRNKDSSAHKFVMKGKEPPPAKDGILGPSRLQADEMTTIYTVPNETFKTEDDVVKYNGFEIMEQIGKGGFAVVFKAKNIQSGQLVACKTVKVASSDAVLEMKNELFIMEMVDNPFAVKLYLHFLVSEKLFIFMQLADAGSFGKLLEKGGAMEEKDSKFYFAQMACGVNHMHQCNIAHRDIKPANFLMAEHPSGKKIVMVSDYGLSRVVHKNGNDPVMYTTQCGTPAYMAPEILSGTEYNCYLVDVWSLGVTLYAMLNLNTPFNVDTDDYGVKAMTNKEWEFSEEMKAPASPELKSIMDGVLEPEPSSRLDMKGMMEHKWLAADVEEVKKLPATAGKSSKK